VGVSVRKKGSDWYIFVRHAGQRCAQRCVDEEHAIETQRAVSKAIAAGLFDIAAMQKKRESEAKPLPTLAEYYDRFTRVYLETSVREGTRSRYKTSFDHHILPELRDLRLDKITRERVKDFVAHLVGKRYQKRLKVKTYPNPLKKRNPTITYDVTQEPLSKTSIRIILSQLGALFSHAVEEGVIQTNPTLRLGRYYKQARTIHEEIQPLTSDEVPVFLSAVLKRSASKDYYPLFLCAIHTGTRAGELIGLKWGDIDFKGQFLTVRRSFTRGKEQPTKTGKARRVDLSDPLLAELAALRKRRRKDYLERGSNGIPEWVFCNREGNPLEYYNLKHRHFEKCLEAAGLRRILIQNGESLAYVKDQLGHSSIKMTVDVYGHLVPGANRAAVNRLPSLGSKPLARLRTS
jgi:integrase